MTEYIVDSYGLRKAELTRCHNCVKHSESKEAPFVIHCEQWDRLMGWNGFCHLGAKGTKNGILEK